jgi:hypothetical protein
MKKVEREIKKVTVPVRPECLACPDFRGMLQEPEKYGARDADDIAVFALRLCSGRNPNPTLDAYKPEELDELGCDPELLLAVQALCKVGQAKLTHDARLKMKQLTSWSDGEIEARLRGEPF